MKNSTRPNRLTHNNILKFVAVLILGAWLSSCGSGPGQKPASPKLPGEDLREPSVTDVDLRLPASDFSTTFSAAETALGQFNWMRAGTILEDVATQADNRADTAYLSYLQARILYLRGEPDTALTLLQAIQYREPRSALTSKISNFQRHITQMSGDYLNSARLGDQMLRIETRSDLQAGLRRDIWHDLHRLDIATVSSNNTRLGDEQWRGWLDLIALDQPGTDPQEQRIALKQWLARYPDHPAAQALPGGLNQLLIDATRLTSVALLLPLSGRLAPAARAVRDGYLASYYAGRDKGAPQQNVIVMDIESFPSATAAYTDAIARGVGLVVGPLSKQAVAELAARPERSVPILALNRTERGASAATAALVQLSLAPEDEALQIAKVAFGRGLRRALILRPAGEWGDKVEGALRKRWTTLGADVTRSISYGSQEDYSNSIMLGLNLNASQQRASGVRSMLAENIEFTPRRRDDLDVIFLLTRNGAEARSLKPLLAYHYAGALPVYATSSVYSGAPDNRDKDLDGINLVETPWLLGSNPGLRVAIATGNTGSDNYTRLNALGADAYRIQTRFTQLQAGSDALISGDTGLLSMDPSLQIRRELSLATFDGGNLRAQ